MSSRTVCGIILNALRGLTDPKLRVFCEKLTEPEWEPQIYASDVYNKSRTEIAELLVSRCSSGAVDRTINTLRDIGCNFEADELAKEVADLLQPEPRSSRSPAGASKDLPQPAQKRARSQTPPPQFSLRSSTSAKDIIRSNKTSILNILSRDHSLILNKVQELRLITDREYRGFKRKDSEGCVGELLDELMNKGEDNCQSFLNLLETDDDIKETFPLLRTLQLSHTTSN